MRILNKKKLIWPLAILLCVILGGIRVGDKEPVAVYAASEFDLYLSGTLTPGATLTATPPTGSLTESWAGTYIVFCEHEAMAQAVGCGD